MARKGNPAQNSLAMVGMALGMTQEDMTKLQILKTLGELGGEVAREDEIRCEGKSFILPENFRGDLRGAAQYLLDKDEQDNTPHNFERTFRYRPNDVAHALSETLKKVFGTTGIGKATVTMFGSTPPTFKTINTGPDTQTQVIQGKTAFAPLEAVITVAVDHNPELGFIGKIMVLAPRRYRAQVEGLFIAIEQELAEYSIYRGKVINGAEDPQFLDVSRVDPAKVVYTDAVMRQLKANIWSLLDHSEAMKKAGLPLKRSVLIHGPYGTGKSLAAALTAQKAQKNGWTFIQVRPSDDLKMAMQTAQLYAPAVVFFEDIDTVAENGDPRDVSELLDVFDGIANKGVEVITVMTTNFVDRIQKGLLRPGRMDAVIEIGAMDKAGLQRLIESVVKPEMLTPLEEHLDYDEIAKAFEGFLPAFAKEAIDRAVRYAISESEGVSVLLSTADFVAAAEGLRPQLELMNAADEAKRTPSLDAVFRETARQAIHGMELMDTDYIAPGSDEWTKKGASGLSFKVRTAPEES